MPRFILSAPDGKRYFVNAPEGMSQDDIIRKASAELGFGGEETPEEPQRRSASEELADIMRRPVVPDRESILMPSLRRGFTRMGSTLGDVLPAIAASAVGADEYAKRQMEEARATEEEIQRTNPPVFQSYKNIKGAGDILPFATEKIGEQGANILSLLVPGGAGAALGRRAAVGAAEKALAGTAEKRLAAEAAAEIAPRMTAEAATARLAESEAGKRLLERAGSKGAERGALLGTYLGGTAPMGAAEVFQNVEERTGEMAPGTAVLTGGLVGALDVLAPARAILAFNKIPGLKAEVAAKLAESRGMQAGLIPFVKDIALASVKGAATEGVTEPAQELLSIAAERIVGHINDKFSPEEIDRVIDSSVSALAPGMVFGATEGIGTRGREMRETERQQFAIDQKEAEARTAESEAAEKEALSVEIPEIEQRIADLKEALNDPTIQNRKIAQFQLSELLQEYSQKTDRLDTLGLMPEERRRKEETKAQQAQAAPVARQAAPQTEAADQTNVPTVSKVLESVGIPIRDASKTIVEWNKEEGREEGRKHFVPFDSKASGLALGQLKTFLDKWTPKSSEQAEAIDRFYNEYEQLKPDVLSATSEADRVKLVDKAPSVKGKKYDRWVFDMLAGYEPGTDTTTDENLYEKFSDAMNISEARGNTNIAKKIDNTINTLFPEIRAREATPTAAAVPQPVAQQVAPTPTPAAPTEEAVAPTPATEAQQVAPTEEGPTQEQIDAALRAQAQQEEAQQAAEAAAQDAETAEAEATTPEKEALSEQRKEDRIKRVTQEFKNNEFEALLGYGLGENESGVPNSVLSFARGSVDAAVGNQSDYGSLGEALDSARENIRDTLNEDRMSKHEQAAFDAFDAAAQEVLPGYRYGISAEREQTGAKAPAPEPATEAQQVAPEEESIFAETLQPEPEVAPEEATVAPEPATEAQQVAPVEEVETAPVEEVEVPPAPTPKPKQARAKKVVPPAETGQVEEAPAQPQTNAEFAADLIEPGEELTAPQLQARARQAGRPITLTDAKNAFDLPKKAAPKKAAPKKAAPKKAKAKPAPSPALAVEQRLAEKFPNREEHSADDVRDYLQTEIGIEDDKEAARLTRNFMNPRRRLTAEQKQAVERKSKEDATVEERDIDYSLGEIPPTRRSNPKSARAALESMLGPDAERVTVSSNPAAAGFRNMNPQARGAVVNGRAYLFTDNMQSGEEFAVFLHEVGGHLGFRGLVGDANYNYFLTKINGWASGKANTREAKIAAAAMDRVKAAKKAEPGTRAEDEVIPYFIEEAVRRGVNPTTVSQTQTPIGAFFRKLIDGFKAALRRFGITSYEPNAQEIVDLAFAAARLDPPASTVSATDQMATYSLNVPTAKRTLKDMTFDWTQNVIERSPAWSRGAVENAVSKISNAPTSLRDLFYSLRSMYEMAEIAEKTNPRLAQEIRNIDKLMNSRSQKIGDRKRELERILMEAKKIMEVTPEKTRALFDYLAHESTRLQVDFKKDKNNPLTKQFYTQLPKHLQDLYFTVVDTYAAYGDEYLKVIDRMTDGALSPEMKIRFQQLRKRLHPYLPLYREGEYWLRYVNKEGEPVVEAHESNFDRERAVREIAAEGGTNIVKFARLADITTESVPPTREFTKVIKLLNEKLKGENKGEIINEVYRTYLSLFPNQSIRKQYQRRKGTLGYRTDTLRNFAAVGSKMANDLSQFEIAKDLDASIDRMEQSMKDGGKSASDAEVAIYKNMKAQLAFLRTPIAGPVSSWLSAFNYNWYILGNISSGLVNLTQLPMVTYNLLGGRFGYGKALNKILEGSKLYFGGGRDDTSSMISRITKRPLTDKSILGDKGLKALQNKRPDLVRAFEVAYSRGAIRRSQGHVLSDLRKEGLSDYTGTWPSIQASMGWVFQNSERMNREVTFYAAYELARGSDKLKSDPAKDEKAIEFAIETVENAGGAALPETGPRMFQTGMGKVFGTFKRFALSQLFLQARLFKKAFAEADKTERRVAQTQFLGITAAQLVFSGLKGMPFVGALGLLGSWILGDDDQPWYLDRYILEAFGGTLGGVLNRGLINYITGVDVGSRAELGMVLKLDTERMAEIGPGLYAAEQAFGPAMTTANNMYEAWKKANQGDWMQAIEKSSPSYLRSLERAFRYSTEGVKNSKGLTIAEDPSSFNIAMQMLGFAPANINEVMTLNSIRNREARNAGDRRNGLLQALWMANKEGDYEEVSEIYEDINKFNQSKWGQLNPIDGNSIKKSAKMHQYIEQNALNGMMYPKAYREELSRIGTDY